MPVIYSDAQNALMPKMSTIYPYTQNYLFLRSKCPLIISVPKIALIYPMLKIPTIYSNAQTPDFRLSLPLFSRFLDEIHFNVNHLHTYTNFNCILLFKDVFSFHPLLITTCQSWLSVCLCRMKRKGGGESKVHNASESGRRKCSSMEKLRLEYPVTHKQIQHFWPHTFAQ